MNTRNCLRCGQEIPSGRNSQAIYCSNKCQNYHKPKSPVPYTTPTAGAISELIVATDLLRKGYGVFRAISSSCPCDLIAIHPDGRTWRIEVRSAWKSTAGKVYANTNDKTKYDIHAAVNEGIITYTPDDSFPELPPIRGAICK